MYNTVSTFDVMAADESQQRVAARSALALAHTRVENHLGRFLRGAVSMSEFETRMAACQEQFAGYVTEACEECGHDKPEHISKALVDHYAKDRRWQPRGSADPVPFDRTAAGEFSDPYGPGPYYVDHDPVTSPKCVGCGTPMNPVDAMVGGGAEPVCHNCAARGHQEAAGGPWSRERQLDDYQGYPDEQAYYGKQAMGEAFNPAMQMSPPPGQTCPGCQGHGTLDGHHACPHCGGQGMVQSVLDAVASTKTADGNKTPGRNTDLGDPGPGHKMDKRKWTPENLEQDLSVEEGGLWPTKRKDVLAPIVPANDHELVEIGEQTTERQALPAGGINLNDSGFAEPKADLGAAPMKWQDKGKHVEPVTHKTQ